MPDQPDLFGHSPAQGSLFGTGDDRLQAPANGSCPTGEGPTPPEGADRKGALGRKDAVVGAGRSDVADRVLNMANWLPDDEADQLRFEFAREMERLKQAT